MNIILPIIINVITLLIIVIGVMIGAKHGFSCQLTKFILTIGIIVGCYFLTPTVTNLLLKVEFISNINLTLNGLLSSLVFLLEFLILYILISIIVDSLSNCIINGKLDLNTARRTKIVGMNKKDTRELRRQEKLFRKQERANSILLKQSRVAGAIFGGLLGLIFGFMIMLPIVNISKNISTELPKYEYVAKSMDYTIYGQIDKATNIYHLMIKE